MRMVVFYDLLPALQNNLYSVKSQIVISPIPLLLSILIEIITNPCM